MALSDQSMHALAQAITSEIVEQIFASDAYVEFMMEAIPNVIFDKMGDIDDELLGELAFIVFNHINLVPVSKVSQ